jgi:hypothetical protein
MSQATSEGYRLLHRDLSALSYSDLAAFLALNMRETELYDYKYDFPKDGAILAKTLAAFANTAGGVLLVGVAQDKNTGGPWKVVGVDGSENELIERVRQIALRNVFPALPIEAKAIPIPDGQKAAGRLVLVVRVHASPQAPHVMVDTNAIYVRTGDISHPEKFPELRWLEHLQVRRREPEGKRSQLWDESLGLAQSYAAAEAAKSLWWLIVAVSPTYPFNDLKGERDVRQTMSELIGDSVPCPSGAIRRHVFAVAEQGRGVEFTRLHATGFVFHARAFPSSFQMLAGQWLAEQLASDWRLGAKTLRKLGWSGHASIRAELRNVLGRRLDPTVSFQSVVNDITVEEQVLAPEMMSEEGYTAAGRLLDRLIWGMGHIGYGLEQAVGVMTHELSRQ